MAINIYPPVLSEIGARRASSYLYQVTFELDSRLNKFEDYLLESTFEDGSLQGYIQCSIKDSQGGNILQSSSGFILKTPIEKNEIKKTITIEFLEEDFKSSFFLGKDYLNRALILSISLYGKDASPKSDKSETDQSWILKNQQYISNGSSDAQFYFISDFEKFLINNKTNAELFLTNANDEGFKNNISQSLLSSWVSNPLEINKEDLSGNFSTSLNFIDTEELDTFSSYRLRYFSFDEASLSIKESLYDSGNKKNLTKTITQSIGKDLPSDAWIYIQLDITTDKGFSGSFVRLVFSIEDYVGETEKDISVQPLNELGANKIVFSARDGLKEKLVLKRSSYLSNFSNWENLYTFEEAQDGEYFDFSIESGTAYKYQIQGFSGEDKKSPVTTEEAIICLFEHESLIAEGIPLILKLDSKISNFKRIIPETKIETIGSQFPFIRRNGNVNYRQFTLTGLISILGDEQNIFSEKALFNKSEETENLYNKYNSLNSISKYNNFVLEREFRERVLSFLHKDNVKLFRSLPEGNLLIKIMDISLTPNETLGRLIYSFSCTAYEVADATLENMKKYNILGDLPTTLQIS